MRNLYGVLSILLLACVAGNSAYGALASKGYVDQWKFDVLQGTENANKAVITAPVTGKVTLGQIKTAMIENSAVTNLKLATDSVASENIINGDVKTDDIADGAITRAKLADDIVIPTVPDMTQFEKIENKVTDGNYTSTDTVKYPSINTAHIIATAVATAQINALNVSDTAAAGKQVTAVSQSAGKISVTRAYTQIPVGNPTNNPTSAAYIWVE